MNTYGYVGANPIDAIDPFGLDTQMCHRLFAPAPYARHCFIQFDGNSQDTLSFNLEGVGDDAKPDSDSKECTDIKPDRDECLRKQFQNCKADNYDLLRFNCCHCVEQAMKACGQTIPKQSWPNWPMNPGPQPGEPGYDSQPFWKKEDVKKTTASPGSPAEKKQ